MQRQLKAWKCAFRIQGGYSCERMSSFGQKEGEDKFWATPELVQKLLETLDLSSISALAEAAEYSDVHGITIKILQGASVWNKLMRRSWGSASSFSNIGKRFEEETIMIHHLTKILQRMEKPKPLLMNLLEFICEKSRGSSESGVRVTCSCNIGGHLMSERGFMHLEEVEGAFASAEQQIEKISVGKLSPGGFLSALSSRATRQERMIDMKISNIECDSVNSANALYNLLKKWGFQRADGQPELTVTVGQEMDAEGWEALGKATSFKPGFFTRIVASRKAMLSANRRDLKTIWNAFESPGIWFVTKNVHRGIHGDNLIEGFRKVRRLGEEEPFAKHWAKMGEFLDRAVEEEG